MGNELQQGSMDEQLQQTNEYEELKNRHEQLDQAIAELELENKKYKEMIGIHPNGVYSCERCPQKYNNILAMCPLYQNKVCMGCSEYWKDWEFLTTLLNSIQND